MQISSTASEVRPVPMDPGKPQQATGTKLQHCSSRRVNVDLGQPDNPSSAIGSAGGVCGAGPARVLSNGNIHCDEQIAPYLCTGNIVVCTK